MATMSFTNHVFESVARNFLAGRIGMAHDLYRCDPAAQPIRYEDFERFFARELLEREPHAYALGMLHRAYDAERSSPMREEYRRAIEALEGFNGFQVRKLQAQLQGRANPHLVGGFELAELALRIARSA